MAGLENVKRRAKAGHDDSYLEVGQNDWYPEIPALSYAFDNLDLVPGGGPIPRSIVYDYLDLDQAKIQKISKNVFDKDSWIGGQGVLRAGDHFCIFDDATPNDVRAIPFEEASIIIWTPILMEAMWPEELRAKDKVRDLVVNYRNPETTRIVRLDMCQTVPLAMRAMTMGKSYAERVG